MVAKALCARIDRPAGVPRIVLLGVYHERVVYALQAEKHLSDMVVAKALSARIDRPAGVIRFAARKVPAELLNGWARSIGRLLEIVEKSTQNIQKESMVHKVPIGAS